MFYCTSSLLGFVGIVILLSGLAMSIKKHDLALGRVVGLLDKIA
jgi:hypothetical protein